MLASAKGAALMTSARLMATLSNDFGPLSHNTLSYKISGVTEYISEGNTIVTSPGKVVYMSAGAQFRTNVVEPGEYIEVRYLSPNADPPCVELFYGFNAAEMEAAFTGAAASYSDKDDAAYFKSQIFLNRIFLLIAQSSNTYLSKRNRELLTPAIEYMKEHILDPAFTVSDLVDRSGVSDTYFRKLFTSFYHMTPQRYIINERINYAKQVLYHEPDISIQALSEYVGYNDAFYFSRLFKKVTGESPSTYAKRASRLSEDDISDADAMLP